MKRISMHQLHECFLHLSHQDLILDVRSAKEYASGHVPGSWHIPYDQLTSSMIDELKVWKKIFVYCRIGQRAQIAAYLLESMGCQEIICVVESGMQDWIEAGFQIAV